MVLIQKCWYVYNVWLMLFKRNVKSNRIIRNGIMCFQRPASWSSLLVELLQSCPVRFPNIKHIELNIRKQQNTNGYDYCWTSLGQVCWVHVPLKPGCQLLCVCVLFANVCCLAMHWRKLKFISLMPWRSWAVTSLLVCSSWLLGFVT
jgi:hypothetical protein